MPFHKQIKLLTLYSCGHFLVDLTCAFLMLTLTAGARGQALTCLLLYNFCAFALQMPCGLIADKLNRNGAVAVLGFVLTLLAFAFFPLPLLCSAVLGIGNCVYHVGGGVDVLHFSDKKQWMLGIYVSPGAIGLFMGSLLAGKSLLSLPVGFFIIFTLFAMIALLLHLTHPLAASSENALLSIKTNGRAPALAIIALFSVVVLRSYVGCTLSFSWNVGILAFVSVLALAFGKAFGGVLADRLGAIPSAALTLSLSALFFLFSDNPICGLLAIFLFNMTMPMTLFAMSKLFGGARGFAFGILTFAIFLGYLPSHFSLSVPFGGAKWLYAAEAFISFVLLAIGLIAAGKPKGERNV